MLIMSDRDRVLLVVEVSVGKPLEDEEVDAEMLVRLGALPPITEKT
jgi:hypothetical protein